jgi:hypothetical protein
MAKDDRVFSRHTRNRWLLGAFVGVLAALLARQTFSAETIGRDWVVSDSIAVRYFGAGVGDWGIVASEPAIQASPNGHYFFVLSWRGDLVCECVIHTLEVFDAQRVRGWLKGHKPTSLPLEALRSIEMRGGKRGASSPMRRVRWSKDGTAIEFIGVDDEIKDQIYRLDVPSGELRALTNEPSRKGEVFRTSDVLLYLRRVPLDLSGKTAVPILEAAPRNALGDIQFRRWPILEQDEWVASYHGAEPWIFPSWFPSDMEPWFSPDGRRAVFSTMYEPPDRYVIADFENHQVEVLSEVGPLAPNSDDLSVKNVPPQVFWTRDSKQVIVVNTTLPRGSASSPAPPGNVAVYDLESRAWQTLEAIKWADGRQVRLAGWLKPDEEFLIAHERNGRPTVGAVYTRNGNQWKGRTVPASVGLVASKKVELPAGLKVAVRESANEPPVLFASEGGREGALSKPDPALDGVWWARLDPFTWQLPNGTSQTGGLSLPRNMQSGTPVPLVVQVDMYYPDLFLPDGALPTGFARQALVAKGIAVLVVPTRDLSMDIATHDGPAFVARMEPAVEALARQGVVDPKRVGIIGHSRTGYLTHYAITHPGRVQPIAAEIWDSVTGSFPEYLEEAAHTNYTGSFERVNGGSFWQSKVEWLKEDVLFNVDRVQAATLFVETGMPDEIRTASGPGLVTLLTLGAYQAAGRPVDYLSIRNSGHLMTRVHQHGPAMEVTVDWMRFWLKGEEDPAAEKSEQYARWRLIRQRASDRKQDKP